MIFKKSLGQVFLANSDVVKFICNIVDLKNKNVLEIGPGKGILTFDILKLTKKIVCIEKDDQFSNYLRKKISDVKIINFDVLKCDIDAIISKEFKNKAIIIGNLPYNIASQILIKLIKCSKWNEMILMFQKEFAKKLLNNKKQNYYSHYISIFTTHKIVKIVSKKDFFPIPKIDSAIVHFKKHKYIDLKLLNDDFLFFLKNIFKWKRKTLINNLKSFSKEFKAKKWEMELKNVNIKVNIRVQELTIKQIYNIFIIFKYKS